MKDVPQRHERIYITRQHLISLSFTTLGIAVLTFALGYKVGYSRDISTEDSESILLLPDIQKQQTLESLLRQIERTEKKSSEISGTKITSPIIGTAYLAPEPGGKKFVEKGRKIKKGDTVMIVEAMKTMNHVPCPMDGTIKEICVEDGQPVEFGQTIAILD